MNKRKSMVLALSRRPCVGLYISDKATPKQVSKQTGYRDRQQDFERSLRLTVNLKRLFFMVSQDCKSAVTDARNSGIKLWSGR